MGIFHETGTGLRYDRIYQSRSTYLPKLNFISQMFYRQMPLKKACFSAEIGNENESGWHVMLTKANTEIFNVLWVKFSAVKAI